MRHLIRGFLYVIAAIPFPIIYLLSDFFSFVVFRLFGYRKQVVLDNLRNSFPEKSAEEIRKIRRKFYKNFTDVFLEMVKMLSMSGKTIEKRSKILNPEVVKKYHDQGQSVLFVGGHCANWEWLGMSIAYYMDRDTYSVYKPLKNEKLGGLLEEMRSQTGNHLVPMKSFLRTILKNKDRGVVNFMLADQTPHVGEIEYFTDFLHQDTPVFLGVEKITKAVKMPLFFMDIRRVKRGHYEIEFVALFDNYDGVNTYEVTQKHLQALENLIKAEPSDWLWSHRRWKYTRKHVENHNKK